MGVKITGHRNCVTNTPYIRESVRGRQHGLVREATGVVLARLSFDNLVGLALTVVAALDRRNGLTLPVTVALLPVSSSLG